MCQDTPIGTSIWQWIKQTKPLPSWSSYLYNSAGWIWFPPFYS